MCSGLGDLRNTGLRTGHSLPLQGNLGLRDLCRALGCRWKCFEWGPTLGLEVGDQLRGYFCKYSLRQCLSRGLPRRRGASSVMTHDSFPRSTFHTPERIQNPTPNPAPGSDERVSIPTHIRERWKTKLHLSVDRLHQSCPYSHSGSGGRAQTALCHEQLPPRSVYAGVHHQHPAAPWPRSQHHPHPR